MTSHTVLVAGATGTTGAAVLAQLVEAGHDVRALSRSPERAAALRRPGVDAVAAPFDDADALRRAFEGVTAAYLVTPSSPTLPETEGRFARAAADAGAHLVKLSVLGAAPESPLRFGRMHAGSEAVIEALGGSWTFVQPTGFMQNDLAWAAQIPSGTIAGPVMDAAWSVVDVRDVAAVAVAALVDPGAHAGRRIAVTGPEARTPRDRVRALGQILGRALDAVDLPIPAVQETLHGYGMPPWEVDGLAELFELYAGGHAAGVAPDAKAVLGRPTRRWEAFATDHVSPFTGGVDVAG